MCIWSLLHAHLTHEPLQKKNVKISTKIRQFMKVLHIFFHPFMSEITKMWIVLKCLGASICEHSDELSDGFFQLSNYQFLYNGHTT
jgi:hypothetical protein